jgi:hypothetical protein
VHRCAIFAVKSGSLVLFQKELCGQDYTFEILSGYFTHWRHDIVRFTGDTVYSCANSRVLPFGLATLCADGLETLGVRPSPKPCQQSWKKTTTQYGPMVISFIR